MQQHRVRHHVDWRVAIRVPAPHGFHRPVRSCDDGGGTAEHGTVEARVEAVRHALDRRGCFRDDAVLGAVDRHDRGYPPHEVEAGVRRGLPVEVQNVEAVRVDVGDATPREQPGVELGAEARGVDIRQPERPVHPESLAQRTADEAFGKGQVLRQQDVLAGDRRLPRQFLQQEPVKRRESENPGVHEQDTRHSFMLHRDQPTRYNPGR